MMSNPVEELERDTATLVDTSTLRVVESVNEPLTTTPSVHGGSLQLVSLDLAAGGIRVVIGGAV